MNRHRLTESACRAINQAAKLAVESGCATVEPLCLFWALLQEESLASEILALRNVSFKSLRQSGHLVIDETPESQAGHSSAGGTPSIPFSTEFETVLDEARRKGEMLGRHADVGSEHLLWGLVTIKSPAGRLLAELGIDSEFLADQIESASGMTAEPLVADVRLEHRKQTATDQTDTWRILDAAANRAREGLRVVEDFVRFALDDPHLTRLLKTLRHELTATLDRLDSRALLKSRDTALDVGTQITTQAETIRRTSLDVALASFKRIEEALRTLEEFGKLVSPELSGRLEKLRYTIYTIEKAALSTLASRQQLEGAQLYLLVTERLCHHGSGPAIRDSLAAGVRVVQMREKSMTDRRLIEHGCRIRRWTREADALMIVNDRADLAMLTDADGVHVGQDELTVREARKIVGADRLVGVSTHSIEQVRQAVLDGADYIGVGPVFPSTTKQFDDFAGLELVRQVAAEITLPWFAIGGIREENVGEVIEAGAKRVAVSNAICGSEHPAEAARQLAAALASRK